MAGLLYRLGRFSARRHWVVVVAWIVIIGLAGVGFSLFKGTISSSISIPGTATEKVTNQLADEFPKASGGSGSVVFETDDGKAFTSTEKSDISAWLKDVGDMSGVKATTDPFTTQARLDDGKQKIVDGRAQIADAKTTLADSQDQLDAGTTQLAGAQKQLDSAVAQAKAAGQYAAAKAQLDQQQSVLDSQTATLEANQKKIDEGTAKLEAQSTTLELNSKVLDLSSNIRFVSKDDTTAVGSVQFTTGTYEVDPDLKTAIVEKSDKGIDGVHVYVSSDIAAGVPSIVGPGEVVGVIVAAIVLLIMLSTIIGAILPLLSAVVGLGASVLGAMAFSGVVEFNSVTTVLGIMLGLAVGIDYSLFILNRHRKQLKQGMELHESIGLANGTSGNAVVFAGSTVIVALLALNVTGIPFLGLMGTVGAAAVLVAILVAITFTPAMLSLVGIRILRKKERAAIGNTGSTRVPNSPMKTWRAVVTLIVGVVVLGVVALPAMQMRLGLPDGSSEATDSSQYKAYKALEKEFGAGQNSPLVVVANLPEKATGDDLLKQEITVGDAISAKSDVSAVVPIGASNDGTLVAFQVVPKGGPSSESTETLVHALRDMSPVTSDSGDITLGVAGNASANIDVSEKLATALPIYLVLVVGLSLLILILVFRSILVPLTATAGFVLSLLATFGALTAVYQFGWASAVFGVHDPAPILSFLPVIEVGVLFGLAMDYQLFLVSGMREAYAHGAPAKIAVQRGLYAGRAVVTAAAIIMISVFSGFIFSESSTIRPIGFGLAFGVLLDAFVVRMLLIPAAMHLLGKSAWWFPKWLDRIVPDVDVEGAKLERSHPDAETAGEGSSAAAGSHAHAHAAPAPVDAPGSAPHEPHPNHRA
ncbi:MMPL family transporter [Frondihabitans sp. VKM Ac-2883]|uniref:MMPL family transporter n=1 Tax=Frondihabitans sp. VKM Ac-2883 TaxID=2783823 RepID=UPI00188BBB62|nr:MMPL family transporter [Frondihabitans sp. VKM Ac-2883]MBF4576920.1 MMPL family transporter [Frondihabitans sp. VKM Ac-2883]